MYFKGSSLALRIGGAAVAVMLVAGCASAPDDPEALAAYEEANDPLEGLNRAVFAVNRALDTVFLKPITQVYVTIVPDFVRDGIHNMILTVRSPVIFANDVLQGEMTRAGETLARTAINLTVGVAGFFDAANDLFGIEPHDEDFGQTLAVWGTGEGPYLMLPVFGPSNPRDAIGLAVDSFLDPLGYFIQFIPWGLTRTVVTGIDARSQTLDALDELERTSVDFYAAVRSLYRQRRADEIRNGEPGANIPAPAISFDEEMYPDDEGTGIGDAPVLSPTDGSDEISLAQ